MRGMKPHEVRRKNLKLLIDQKYEGVVARFADAMGKKRPTIYRLFSDAESSRDIGEDLAREIERVHRLPMHWLDVHHKAMEPLADYNVEPAPQPRSRVPLVARVPGGPPLESAPGNILGHLEFESPASPVAYALQVKGDSMVRPDGTGFPEGCYILVEPRRRPRSGDFVVVRFADADEETFKQFVLDGQVRVLRSLNPTYTTKHVLGPDAEILGTVIEKRIVERF